MRCAFNQEPKELRLLKEFVQVCGRRVIGKEIECAVCLDLLRCPEESTPGCEREAGTDGDAAHADIGESR